MKAAKAFIPASDIAEHTAVERANAFTRWHGSRGPKLGIPPKALARLPTSEGATKQGLAQRPLMRSTLEDLRGGLATLLGCVYVAVLIPNMLGLDSAQLPLASIGATAFACAIGTALFALVTRLPFALGPGIVPASIVATFLAAGIPFNIVLGIEVLAGLLFVGLVLLGAMQGLVCRMPSVLKSVGQIAIGLYLFLAAVRATGFFPAQDIGSALALEHHGFLFLAGLGTVFWLSGSNRFAGYAILIGILLVTASAALLGLVAFPSAAFKMPLLALVTPDVASAFNLQYLDEILILLYVVIVDVVATLETIATCAPQIGGQDGRLAHFNRSMLMSAIVFLVSPFLGMPPMLVFFESLGGVISWARTFRAAFVAVLGFVILMFFAPAANAVPAFACAVALGYIGYAITKHAAMAIPIDPSSMSISRLGRHLTSAAIVLTIVTQSVALTIISLFAIYPVAALKSGQRLKLCDIAAAIVCLGLIVAMLL